MGTVCGRILFENNTLLDDTQVSVSSEQLQFPKTFLSDPIRSKRWRSKLGWNITSDLNDKLDFTEGISGAAVATIPPGNYLNGIDMAVAITGAMNTAATDNTYIVSYNGLTQIFTFTRTGGIATIDLDWSSGPNAAFSVGIDIGFDTSADDTGSSVYSGDFLANHSREWIKYDMGSALTARALIAFDGNFESGTVITIQANATDAWGSPSFSTVLAMDSANQFFKGIAFIAATTFQFWRIIIDDVQNTDGFSEMGVPYIGEYFEPANGYSAAFTENRAELSSIETSDQGTSYQHVRATRRQYPLGWLGETEADKDTFIEFAEFAQVGRPFFMAFEPGIDDQNTLYVMLTRGMQRVFQAPDHWRIATDMSEVLG